MKAPNDVKRFANPPRHLGGHECDAKNCERMARYAVTRRGTRYVFCEKHRPR